MIAGAAKTLVPTLKLGNRYESLFDVWMFVKTPDGKQFPASLYYGPSGTAIRTYKNYDIFLDDIKSISNFNPFTFNTEEKDALSEALELALRKVPVSDFRAVYKHDLGYSIMIVKDGEPYQRDLGYCDKNKVKKLLADPNFY